MRVETQCSKARYLVDKAADPHRTAVYVGLLRIPLSGWCNGSENLDVYARQFGLQCISSTLHTIVF